MAGITRTLTFAEGVETGGPTTTFLQTTEFAIYANDAAYVSSKGAAAEDGDTYYNSTDHVIRFYKNGSWTTIYDVGNSDVVTLTGSQTLTNKTLQLGEAVDLTSTSTELNQLDGVSVGGNTSGDILTTDDTQTLTNKTLTSPSINGSNLNFGTASNTNRMLLPNDTAANLDLLTDVAGLLAYDTTSNLISFNNGSLWITISPAGVDSLVTKTTTYTATTSDRIILCDSSGGAFTITLYAASGNAGRRLIFVKTTSDTALVTIDGNGAETINGNATTSISTQYEELELVCDGTNWLVSERKADTAYTSYTPTGSWVTNTTYSGVWRRIGGCMQIEASLTLTGAPTTANLTIGIPSGYTIDTARMSSAIPFRNQFGVALISSTRVYTGNAAYFNTNSVVINHSEAGNFGTVNQSNPVTFGSGDAVYFNAIVPIVGWKGANE